MIEKVLQMAADSLPDPRGDFLSVEEKVRQKKQRPKATHTRRFAIVMVLAVLLVGCVAVSEPDYHLYNGNWWQFSSLGFDLTEIFQPEDNQTQAAADKLGITLPETLGGYGVIRYNRYNLTDQKTLIQFAWLFPRYVYQSSFYGMEMEEPYISEDGTEGSFHWNEGADVTYGPTDDDIWRRQFGYDENNVFLAGNWTLANHPVEEITSFEYEGITVYVAKIGITFRDKPMWDVTWVDEANGVVFSINEYYENPDTLIGYAKQIIGLNK